LGLKGLVANSYFQQIGWEKALEGFIQGVGIWVQKNLGNYFTNLGISRTYLGCAPRGALEGLKVRKPWLVIAPNFQEVGGFKKVPGIGT